MIVDFIVTYPGPKNNGEGTAADGVNVASAAANAITIPNIAILIPPPANNTTPILKNRTIVTVFDRKFVIMHAQRHNNTTKTPGAICEKTGLKRLLILAVITVFSDL